MKFKDMPYERLDFENVRAELKGLTEKVKTAESGEELWEIHQGYYRIFQSAMDAMTISHIRHDADTSDGFYSAEQDYYDRVEPQLAQFLNDYRKAVYESPLRPFLEKKIGGVAFATMENRLKSMDERIVGLMQEENALITVYEKLMASARIPFAGEERNLSLMRPFLTGSDRKVRREAWKAYSRWFSGVEEELDSLFDRLVANRTAQARAMGYDNFVTLGYYRMNRNSYGRKEVENFRRQVKQVFVPLAERVHERRRRRLGLEKLSYVDNEVYFPQGNPVPVGTPEEILRAGRDMYRELSEETGAFIDFMMENELFDVFGRKSKKQGGYMAYLYRYGAPFVFANFNGTAGDVDVITHECGHAFQGFLSGQDPILEHSEITMDTAEIHSMSMEFFTNPWMESFFGERSGDFLTMQLEDAICFVPYGTMVDEFQHIVYENPQMTPAERKQTWRELEREYKPHLDYEGDAFFGKGGFWQKQQHIYTSPFYYIDYVLAQTCAFQYKVWMEEDYRAAWDSYLQLCRLSAGGFYGDMLRCAGLKVPFEDGYFERIVKGLEEKLEKN